MRKNLDGTTDSVGDGEQPTPYVLTGFEVRITDADGNVTTEEYTVSEGENTLSYTVRGGLSYEFVALYEPLVVVYHVNAKAGTVAERVDIVTRNKEVIESALKLGQARLCPPLVEQYAAAAALTVRDEYIENVRAEYERRRNVLIKLMQRIPGVRCNLPKGAFYFVADLPVDDAEKFALFMLRDFSYEGCTVMFASAEDFYVTPGIGRNQARFSYVLNEDELVMAAKCLEEGLKAYRRDVMRIR